MKTALLAAAALALSCGDALVDGRYRGAPLFTINGDFEVQSPLTIESPEKMRLALFFAPGGAADLDDPAKLVELASTADRQPSMVETFTLHVFDRPAAEHMAGAQRDWAIARILSYLDEDLDGRRGAAETVHGAELYRVVLFAAAEVPAERSPTGLPLAPGYHGASIPLSCGPRALTRGDAECGVALGARCAKDADCGAGASCLLQLGRPFPEGYCTIREAAGACRPRDGVRFEQGPDAVWLKACSVDSDCARPTPYQCDQSLGACYASSFGRVTMNPDALASVCGTGAPQQPQQPKECVSNTECTSNECPAGSDGCTCAPRPSGSKICAPTCSTPQDCPSGYTDCRPEGFCVRPPPGG